MTPDGTAGAVHVPVMTERIETLLAPVLDEPGAVMVDATLGLAGHSLVLLERFPDMRLIGIDRDKRALDLAHQRLAQYTSRVTLVHAVYDQLAPVLNELGLTTVTGILMDLGVSSLQLDEKQRGFAYAFDAPLDMRMDSDLGLTAAEVLNTYSATELARILRSYGEERFARRIANAVVNERASEPFVNSGRLVDVIRRALPAATMRTGGHPAKRTFQALRIEVNDELGSLEQACPTAVEALAVRGRLVVLSYHSLEDRLVKRCFAAFATDDVPSDFPVPGRGPEIRLLTRGCERPDASETEHNPRAASARLRAAERVRVAA